MNNIKSIIIEDEPHAQKLLEKYILDSSFPFEIVGVSDNIEDGEKIIRQLMPQVVFLDIRIKNKTGFDLLNRLQDLDFYTIFVTSYIEYALQAIKNDAFEYILKPIDTDELNTALEKVSNILEKTHQIKLKNQRLEIKSQRSCYYINKQNIIGLKAAGSYTEILTKSKNYTISKNLSQTLKEIDESIFFRTHNSFAINLNEVLEYVYETNLILMKNKMEFPLAHRRKEEFQKIMKSL